MKLLSFRIFPLTAPVILALAVPIPSLRLFAAPARGGIITQPNMCCALGSSTPPDTLTCNSSQCYPPNMDGCRSEGHSAWGIVTYATCQAGPPYNCIMQIQTYTQHHYSCDRNYTGCTTPLRKCSWTDDGNSQDSNGYQCAPSSDICGPQ
jgi:hypothetical protein